MLAIGRKPSGLHCSYRWRIDDRDGLDNFLLVGLGTGSFEVTDDGGHAGLVAHRGSQVDGLLAVILGKAAEPIIVSPCLATWCDGEIGDSRLDLAAVAGSALPWQESQGAVARSLKLAMLATELALERSRTRILDVHSFWRTRCEG